MRVALIAPLVSTLAQPYLGGAQALLADLAQGLVRRGHTVTLFARDGSFVPGISIEPVAVPESVRPATSPSHYRGAVLMKVSLRKPISFSNSFSSYDGAVPILTWFMFTHSTGQPSPAVPWYRIYLSSIPSTCQRFHQRLTRPYVCYTGRDTLSR